MSLKTFLFRLSLVGGVALAAYLVWRGLSRYSLAEIGHSLAAIPPGRLAAAIAFTACSYLCLTGFDALALRHVGKPLAYPKVALASFVSLGIGHNVGIASLSSGAVRYRYYSRWGVKAADVARLVVFCGVTVCLGLATLGGVALLAFPHDAEGLIGLTPGQLKLAAATALAMPVAYVAASAFVSRPIGIGKWSMELPTAKLAIAQTAVGAANFAFVAASLYQLVAIFTDASYLRVASIYVISNTAAIATHVPGGIGVLEAGIQTLLSASGAIGALIAFRAIYFFLPLAIALPLLVVSEHVLREPGRDQKRDSLAIQPARVPRRS
jgi:uncharacterized membrane protein YbhN (UPF0104 family)